MADSKVQAHRHIAGIISSFGEVTLPLDNGPGGFKSLHPSYLPIYSCFRLSTMSDRKSPIDRPPEDDEWSYAGTSGSGKPRPILKDEYRRRLLRAHRRSQENLRAQVEGDREGSLWRSTMSANASSRRYADDDARHEEREPFPAYESDVDDEFADEEDRRRPRARTRTDELSRSRSRPRRARDRSPSEDHNPPGAGPFALDLDDMDRDYYQKPRTPRIAVPLDSSTATLPIRSSYSRERRPYFALGDDEYEPSRTDRLRPPTEEGIPSTTRRSSVDHEGHMRRPSTGSGSGSGSGGHTPIRIVFRGADGRDRWDMLDRMAGEPVNLRSHSQRRDTLPTEEREYYPVRRPTSSGPSLSRPAGGMAPYPPPTPDDPTEVPYVTVQHQPNSRRRRPSLYLSTEDEYTRPRRPSSSSLLDPEYRSPSAFESRERRYSATTGLSPTDLPPQHQHSRRRSHSGSGSESSGGRTTRIWSRSTMAGECISCRRTTRGEYRREIETYIDQETSEGKARIVSTAVKSRPMCKSVSTVSRSHRDLANVSASSQSMTSPSALLGPRGPGPVGRRLAMNRMNTCRQVCNV